MAILESTPQAETEYATIPAGTLLEAIVDDVDTRTFKWNNPDTGKTEEVTKLRWNFIVTEEGEYKGKKVHGETSTTFTNHPNCKAMNWAMALTGRTFPPESKLDTDELMGLAAKVAMINREDKQGRVWHNVGQVFASGSGAKSAEDLF